MYKAIVLCLFVLISFSATVPSCPKGEIYDLCGTPCPLTCDEPEPGVCSDRCVPGCYCPEGQLRNRHNKCVQRDRCYCCPKGETWIECSTGCPPTCAKPKPTICTLQCVTGCACNSGTVRNEATGKCVPVEDCRCPDGEHWTECGSACNATCANPSPRCTQQCVARCSCKSGHVRDENNQNKCIRLEKCPRC